MFPILVGLMLLVILLVSALPGWGWNKKWGYGPSIFFGLVFAAVVILLIFGDVPYRY